MAKYENETARQREERLKDDAKAAAARKETERVASGKREASKAVEAGAATDAEYLKAHKANVKVADQATYGSVDERIARQAYAKQEAVKLASEDAAKQANPPKPALLVPYPAQLTVNQNLHKELTAAKHECDKQNARKALVHIQAAISIIESLIDDAAIREYHAPAYAEDGTYTEDGTYVERAYDPDTPPADYRAPYKTP